MSEPKLKTPKPFDISKWVVMEAFQKVKANQGAAGVDGESIEEFEKDLKGNLYRIWNRMSSGSYFPPPVRAVEIPKRAGGSRVLGVSTVSDSIRQNCSDCGEDLSGAGGGADLSPRLLWISPWALCT
jgi:retron-type reverse transcriptase